MLPPFAPAAETWARTTVESNICTKCAVSLIAASASKKASKVPDRLNRQNRFHTLFQCPNFSGSARQVMLWTTKYAGLPENFGRSVPCRHAASEMPRIPSKQSPSPLPSWWSAWSVLQKPTAHESRKSDSGIPYPNARLNPSTRPSKCRGLASCSENKRFSLQFAALYS